MAGEAVKGKFVLGLKVAIKQHDIAFGGNSFEPALLPPTPRTASLLKNCSRKIPDSEKLAWSDELILLSQLTLSIKPQNVTSWGWLG